MKSKSFADIVFVSVFMAFILMVAAVTFFKPKHPSSYYENRMLAQRPALDMHALADDNYFDGWEKYFSDHAAGRETLVRLYTKINLNLLHRPVVNDVVVSEGMYLRYNEYETVDTEKIGGQAKAMAREIAALKDVVASYGGVFYYVALPGQYTYFAEKHPWFLNNREEYTKAELEAFRSEFSAAGIPLIDMGEIFAAMGNPAGFYSASDYHYTFSGAYETYRNIIGRINGDGAYTLPLLEEEDFTFITLPNPYMGSRMRKLMNVPGITERTAIAVLNEPIPFTRTDNGSQRGNPSVYSLPNNQWEEVSYGIYMGGDMAETVIDTGRELPGVLIYGDSFTNPVECFMYTSCGVMRSIDLRHYRDMPLSEYVEQYRPDIVICIRDYEALLALDGNGKVMAD